MRTHAVKKCHYRECDAAVTTGKFCRLHYIAASASAKRRASVNKEKMLDRYVQALTKKFPDEYLNVIKKDLSSKDNFKKTVEDLDLENIEDLDFSDEVDQFFKNIKGKKE